MLIHSLMIALSNRAIARLVSAYRSVIQDYLLIITTQDT